MCLVAGDEPNTSIRAAIDDYVKANQTSFALQPTFQVSNPYTLVPRQDLSRLIGGTWDKFHATYPKSGGIRTFSAVGFNNTKTVAGFPVTLYREQWLTACI